MRKRTPGTAHQIDRRQILYPIILILLSSQIQADGIVIDKIYHPYVQPLERELEWRMVAQDEQPGAPDNIQLHRLAYGQSINDRWFGEIYLQGEKTKDESLVIKGYELEALWQLTEQGEFWADWGALFELEKNAHEDIEEFAASILTEKEWGKWSGTANFSLSREWGSDIEGEWETALALQARYRYLPAFEPALEFYKGENTSGLGPVLLGQYSLGIRRRVKWEAGVIFGLDNESPDDTVRLLVELEF